jgi:transketolase
MDLNRDAVAHEDGRLTLFGDSSGGRGSMEIDALKRRANELRGDVLRMVTMADSGHPGGALGMADLLTVLYYRYLRHDPQNPLWEDRDRFVLSNGHTCPILYAILADRGYFPREELWRFRKLGAMLQGHPSTAWKVPGVEISSGSLGNGLSVALGMAIGAKLAARDSRVYCFVSDAECQEGQPWEAATAAVHHRVDNLCVMVDWNGCQIDGRTVDVMDVGDLAAKFRAFGWTVHEIDGHDHAAIMEAYTSFLAAKGSGMPTAIAAHTTLGKGVSFMENDPKWHHGALSQEQLRAALAELGLEAAPA